jgi:hypothetical protein
MNNGAANNNGVKKAKNWRNNSRQWNSEKADN